MQPLLSLIEETIRQTGIKEVLHIPFARTIATEPEWEGDWFSQYIHIDGLIYLNAANPEDIQKAKAPLIFINGGSKNRNLLQQLLQRPELIEIIKNADVIIGESAGSMILGEQLRVVREDKIELFEGLGIIKNTIIEPHYGERKRQPLLLQELKESGLKYGIGIDCDTAIHFELDEFPQKYEKIGDGVVEVKINPEGKMV